MDKMRAEADSFTLEAGPERWKFAGNRSRCIQLKMGSPRAPKSDDCRLTASFSARAEKRSPGRTKWPDGPGSEAADRAILQKRRIASRRSNYASICSSAAESIDARADGPRIPVEEKRYR